MRVRLESFGTPVVISRNVASLPSMCSFESVIGYEGARSLRQIAEIFAVLCPQGGCATFCGKPSRYQETLYK